MTDIAIRVENCILSEGRQPAVEGLSKRYRIGRAANRHDTTSTVLSASLRDALTDFWPRILRPGSGQVTRISRKPKTNYALQV